jgi:hypothetical protein
MAVYNVSKVDTITEGTTPLLWIQRHWRSRSATDQLLVRDQNEKHGIIRRASYMIGYEVYNPVLRQAIWPQHVAHHSRPSLRRF